MALGQTIGFAHNVSQGDFDGSGRVPTYKDLLGDPTLRMHILKPVPTAPQVVNNGNGVTISWSAAPGAGEDGFQGYYVYRAASASDPFERITPNLVTGPERSVDDPEGVTGNVYMVRAVKLETTPSGTYFNASQGAFSAPVP